MQTENTFWIVMNTDLPTTISYCHTDKESAKEEARRLAKKSGYRFVVMESVYGVEINSIVEVEYEDNSIPFQEDLCITTRSKEN